MKFQGREINWSFVGKDEIPPSPFPPYISFPIDIGIELGIRRYVLKLMKHLTLNRPRQHQKDPSSVRCHLRVGHIPSVNNFIYFSVHLTFSLLSIIIP